MILLAHSNPINITKPDGSTGLELNVTLKLHQNYLLKLCDCYEQLKVVRKVLTIIVILRPQVK